MKSIRCGCLLAFFFLTISLTQADTPYFLSDSRIYRVYCRAMLKNSGGPAQNLRIRFPAFARDGLPPYQELNSWRITPSNLYPETSVKDEYIDFVVPRLERNQSLLLSAEYTFTNWAINYDLKPYSGSLKVDPGYLEPERGIESDAPQIVRQTQKILDRNEAVPDKAKKIFAFVNGYVTYDGNSPVDLGALITLQTRRGSCEGISLLYIALCRAAGIPARIVKGYRFEPEEVAGQEVDLEQFAHQWAEVYLPPCGWTSVEPTFFYQRNGQKTVSFDFFGRIGAQDRHLFSSYSRPKMASSSWDSDLKNPARVEVVYRNSIRGL